jgi:hypothetical protein
MGDAVNLADLKIESCSLPDVKDFVEHWHYSKSVKGLGGGTVYRVWRYVPITTRLLRRANVMKVETVGAAIFGKPAMAQQHKKYSDNYQFNVTELRRFVMVDDAPRCAETYVLGEMLRRLRQQGVQRVLSYSDPSHGHNGVIYRGLGFQMLGKTPPTKVFWLDGKHYSHRSLNRCDGGKLGEASRKLRAAIADGTATIQLEASKYIYLKLLMLAVIALGAALAKALRGLRALKRRIATGLTILALARACRIKKCRNCGWRM